MLSALRTLSSAPFDAASEGSGPSETSKSFRSFAKELWPEIEAQEKAVMERQKALLDSIRGRPILLSGF